MILSFKRLVIDIWRILQLSDIQLFGIHQDFSCI